MAAWDAAQLRVRHPHAEARRAPAELAHGVGLAAKRLATAGIEWRQLHSRGRAQPLSSVELRRRANEATRHGWCQDTVGVQNVLKAMRVSTCLLARPLPPPMISCRTRGEWLWSGLSSEAPPIVGVCGRTDRVGSHDRLL